jgi:lysophospholipase L1-like esterase
MNLPRWARLTLRSTLLLVTAFFVFSGVCACWTFTTAYLSPKDRYLWAQRLSLPDYAQRWVYQTANASSPASPDRTVLIGDSITAGWDLSTYFPGRPYVNRGIAGQSSSQILLRFRQDVIDLRPSAVVILAGVNDLNYGQSPEILRMVEENYEDMADLAIANQIRPMFGTVLPVNESAAQPHPLVRTHPNIAIASLDSWLRQYCRRRGIALIDYGNAMQSADGELQSDLSDDGLHPNAAGYRAMANVLKGTLH